MLCGEVPGERVPATLVPKAERPLWSASFELPRDTYLEYAFYDPGTNQRMPDPFNPRMVDNGLGGWNNFFYMPRAAPTSLAERRNGIKHGSLTRHMVETGFLVEYSLLQRRWLRGMDVEIVAEGDPFPHTRFFTPAAALEAVRTSTSRTLTSAASAGSAIFSGRYSEVARAVAVVPRDRSEGRTSRRCSTFRSALRREAAKSPWTSR